MGVSEYIIEKAQKLNNNPKDLFELLGLTDEQKNEIQKAAKDSGDDPLDAAEKFFSDDDAKQKKIANLKSPLSVLKGVVDTLKDEPKADDDKAPISDENMKLLKMGSKLLEAKKLCDDFHDNPETAALSFMTLEQQELYHTGKTMMGVYNDPLKAIEEAGKLLENAVPEE